MAIIGPGHDDPEYDTYGPAPGATRTPRSGAGWRADRGCQAIWLWPSGRFSRIL
ncbi:hypothetical protein ABZV77_09975 [Streptomyces sp. NPDC004732]|uniref:hypothetical protein n=1 Tax=Streptomyces sp. NPDC004732 TaxID=3154290 RepID=UPI0033B6A1E7